MILSIEFPVDAVMNLLIHLNAVFRILLEMPPALLIANKSGRAGVFSKTFRSSILICHYLKNKK